MNPKRTLTSEEKRLVKEFCEVIFTFPDFTLHYLQGVLPGIIKGAIPAKQTYAEYLAVAIEDDWIEAVPGKPDAYRRTRYKPYKKTPRFSVQVLKDHLTASLTGEPWDE
jgi:hypothetical protein